MTRSKRIVLDPLGGIYHDERINEWRFQKKQVNGMYADVMTVGVANIVYDILRTVDMDVLPTRCLRHSYKEKGESGRPMFQESAYLYLRSLKLRPSLRQERGDPNVPSWIWKDGETTLERDHRARVNFAKFVKPDMVIVLDVTNYAIDKGLEVAHNDIGDANEIARSILKEVARRTRRKVAGVRTLLDDESAYRDLEVPTVILNCGSTFDGHTANLLRQSWYRESLGLGAFAGIWKYLTPPPEAVPAT